MGTPRPHWAASGLNSGGQGGESDITKPDPSEGSPGVWGDEGVFQNFSDR